MISILTTGVLSLGWTTSFHPRRRIIAYLISSPREGIKTSPPSFSRRICYGGYPPFAPSTRTLTTVLMKSPRSPMQVATLARQVYGQGGARKVQGLYERCTCGKKIRLPVAQSGPSLGRIRSDFFHEDRTPDAPFPLVYTL